MDNIALIVFFISSIAFFIYAIKAIYKFIKKDNYKTSRNRMLYSVLVSILSFIVFGVTTDPVDTNAKDKEIVEKEKKEKKEEDKKEETKKTADSSKEEKEKKTDNSKVIPPIKTESDKEIKKEEKKENTKPQKETNLHKVVRVVDGDTIIIDYKGKEERLRLIGVDTPESVHPDKSKNSELGEKASKFTKDKLEGQKVKVEFDVQERDHYGRLLAYVYLNDVMFNKTLVKEGYAQVATYPPNVKYTDDFIALQKIARNDNKGLWAVGMLTKDEIKKQSQASKDKVASKPKQPNKNTQPKKPTNPKGNPNFGQYVDQNGNGLIKGNINSKGERIYHVPGGAFYDKTKIDTSQGERWFKSREEAEAAGWRASKR